VKRWVTLALLLGACRGQPSTQQPVHLVPDMDWQPRFSPEEETELFEDRRTMRPLVDGVVARGTLPIDMGTGKYTGKVGEQWVAKAPIKVDEKTLKRGRERFAIFCTPCHDRTGAGKGMVVQRGYPPPVSLTSERVLTMPDGAIFHTMSNGVRNMPAYRKQIPVDDRWAIVAWVRVLGRSQNAKLDDVPSDKRGSIEPQAGAPQ
jgi:mono/diheme cytochrome c family protein